MDGTAVASRTAGKGGESLPGIMRGGGRWEKEPVRKSLLNGWRVQSVYTACKIFLQILCLCELTAGAMCIENVRKCVCC